MGFFSLCKETNPQIRPFNTNKLREFQSAPHCRLTGGFAAASTGARAGEEGVKGLRWESSPAACRGLDPSFLPQCLMAGESQLQIQMPLSRPRTKLHSLFTISEKTRTSCLWGWAGCRLFLFADLGLRGRRLAWLCFQASQAGSSPPSRGAKRQPRPLGDGHWWGKGRLCPLCPIPRQVAV